MTKTDTQLLFEALRGSLSAQVKAVAYTARYVVVSINGNVHHISITS